MLSSTELRQSGRARSHDEGAGSSATGPAPSPACAVWPVQRQCSAWLPLVRVAEDSSQPFRHFGASRSSGSLMNKVGLALLVALAAAACTTTEQRVSGAAAGAGAGVLVAGPVGAVVGGAAGAIYGPSVNRSARRAMR